MAGFRGAAAAAFHMGTLSQAASCGILALIIILVLWGIWWYVDRRSHVVHKRVSLQRLKFYFRKYGSYSCSYLHLNTALYHYELDGVGLVTYAWLRGYISGTAVIAADPLCSLDNMERLLRAFHHDVPGRHIYMTLTKEVSAVVARLGFSRTQCGKEFHLDLPQWKAPNKQVKRCLKPGVKEGLEVKEQRWSEVDAQRVQQISDSWLGSKAAKGRELRFLTWPLFCGDEWGMRKFYIYTSDDYMVGFIWWTPVWDHGKVIGYCANILRRDVASEVPRSFLLMFAFLSCAEIFRQEGIEHVELGPAYSYDVQKEDGDCPILRLGFRFSWAFLNRLYHLKGLAEHKERCHASRTPCMYQCHRGLYAKFLSLILPYVATEAIPHVSDMLFGKGTFMHQPELLAKDLLAHGDSGRFPTPWTLPHLSSHQLQLSISDEEEEGEDEEAEAEEKAVSRFRQAWLQHHQQQQQQQQQQHPLTPSKMLKRAFSGGKQQQQGTSPHLPTVLEVVTQ